MDENLIEPLRPEVVLHASSSTRPTPQARRLRHALTALALATILLGGWAQPATAQFKPIDHTAVCLFQTNLTTFTTTGGPFEGGTKITWKTTSPANCSTLVVAMNGTTVARNGSAVVDPEATTKYEFRAKMGTSSTHLGSTVALGADVVGYQWGYGITKKMNPNTAEAIKAKQVSGHLTRALSTQAKLQLAGRILEVHIIPADMLLTDLAEWRHLRGTKTCEKKLGDGTPNPACASPRDWDAIRGAGGMLVPGTNRIVMAVGQESLIYGTGRTTRFALGHVLAHELGHVALEFAAPHEMINVKNVLESNKSTHDYMGDDAYTRSTPHEYFAEGTAGLFGYERGSGDNVEFTRQWLTVNEPNLIKILLRIFPGA